MTPSPRRLSARIRRANVMRQALAGMLWSKQYFYFDVDKWLEEHGVDPLQPGEPTSDCAIANGSTWYNDDIISMPDKWEYPWYAAWDLAFHTIALSTVDPDFAKEQLDLMLQRVLPASERSDPGLRVELQRRQPAGACLGHDLHLPHGAGTHGEGDLGFPQALFPEAAARTSPGGSTARTASGKNVFEGGFLGLDNIGVFDRSAPLPTGGHLEQADGTAWMALFCQNMLEIAVELAAHDPIYEDMAAEVRRAFPLDRRGHEPAGPDGMWDEEDGFYYDVLRLPDGKATRLKVRSMVGLLPSVRHHRHRAVAARTDPEIDGSSSRTFLRRMPELLETIHPTGPGHLGYAERGIAALVNRNGCAGSSRMLDENEFLSPYGIRALSRYHAEHPYVVQCRRPGISGELSAGRIGHRHVRRQLQLARSDLDAGERAADPRVAAVLFLLRRQLQDRVPDRLRQLDEPVRGGPGNRRTGSRSIFLRDRDGRRPVYGGTEKFQDDPHWRDYILFYEYFHGDNGAGLGASHQTGWTGLVAGLMHLFAAPDPEKLLKGGKVEIFKGLGRASRAKQRERVTIWPRHPFLYQINTRVWLTELSQPLGRPATLDDIPDAELDRLPKMGFDWIWFLSVWQTGQAGQRVSRTNPEWRKNFEDTLPDLREEDIAGSGFAITGYTVQRDLGGDAALARLRQRLRQRGLRLMLDFVPNHTGLDHPGSKTIPSITFRDGTGPGPGAAKLYLGQAQGRRSAAGLWTRSLFPRLAGHPAAQLRQSRHAGSHDRRIGENRRAMRRRALRHGHAGLAGSLSADLGYPSEAVLAGSHAAVRRTIPGFCFMAEVYWDLEWTLQQQGFDYAYDKRLYDRLREGHARPVREHFRAGLDYQSKLARFLENHDEPRAAATFPPGMHEAAAVITSCPRASVFSIKDSSKADSNASHRTWAGPRRSPRQNA